jgi:hypothetical protein
VKSDAASVCAVSLVSSWPNMNPSFRPAGKCFYIYNAKALTFQMKTAFGFKGMAM